MRKANGVRVRPGGSDPCAAAVLNERVACAVPFHSGGPQPETRYPLPNAMDASAAEWPVYQLK